MTSTNKSADTAAIVDLLLIQFASVDNFSQAALSIGMLHVESADSIGAYNSFEIGMRSEE
jgi:hypothetical protein